MRSGVFRVVPLGLLLLTLAAALEKYNEATPDLAGDTDFQKQYLDAATFNLDGQDEDFTSPYLDQKDLYLYKLLQSLQSGGRRPAVPYRWMNLIRNDMSQNNEGFEDSPNESQSMSSPGVTVIKRFQGTFGSSKAKAKYPIMRPQQKWKIKKGKGTPMVCYFKLCTFRSPA